jgi:hypothetical protein
MRHCPKCKSTEIHPSRTKSKFEQWRKQITGKRPFRCHACDLRYWGFDVSGPFDPAEVELATSAIAPDPPNLKGTALAPEPARGEDLDLLELDVLAQMSPRKEHD